MKQPTAEALIARAQRIAADTRMFTAMLQGIVDAMDSNHAQLHIFATTEDAQHIREADEDLIAALDELATDAADAVKYMRVSVANGRALEARRGN